MTRASRQILLKCLKICNMTKFWSNTYGLNIDKYSTKLMLSFFSLCRVHSKYKLVSNKIKPLDNNHFEIDGKQCL